MYDWDEQKRQANLAKHGVDFADIVWFDFETAYIRVEVRRDYGEERFIATGWLLGRLHVAVFTHRPGVVRVIGLRKANLRECRDYEQTAQKLH